MRNSWYSVLYITPRYTSLSERFLIAVQFANKTLRTWILRQIFLPLSLRSEENYIRIDTLSIYVKIYVYRHRDLSIQAIAPFYRFPQLIPNYRGYISESSLSADRLGKPNRMHNPSYKSDTHCPGDPRFDKSSGDRRISVRIVSQNSLSTNPRYFHFLSRNSFHESSNGTMESTHGQSCPILYRQFVLTQSRVPVFQARWTNVSPPPIEFSCF